MLTAQDDARLSSCWNLRDQLVMGARFTRDVPRFLRNRESLDVALAHIRIRLQQRAPRLLRAVKQAVYEHPASPYLALLQQAGCEYGDLVRLVRQEGVEGALTVLAERDVYVTYDETAGRREIVRGSFRRQYADTDFNNPLVRPHFTSQTGGSGGRAKPLRQGLEWGYEVGWDFAATLDAHGVRNAAFVFWMTAPIFWLLLVPRLGHRIIGWFHPLKQTPRTYTAGARYLSLLARLGGATIPMPRHLDLQQPERMARWLAARLERERPIVLCCPVSSSVRVALAAQDAGLSLDGLSIIAMGEPTTPERRRHLEAAGAQVLTRYSTMESGPIAAGCAAPTAADDSHIFLDRFAVIDRPRTSTTDPDAAHIPSLLVSNLNQLDIKMLLNAETGDYGSRDIRDPECCGLGRLGLTSHIWNIRSFEKLSGEGVSFARSQIDRIIEHTLPARFGGTAVDYQLVEEAGPNGNVRLVLRVAPSCGDLDDDRIRDAFLAALADGTVSDRYQAALLERAQSVTVRRERPQATPGGKMLPFHALHE